MKKLIALGVMLTIVGCGSEKEKVQEVNSIQVQQEETKSDPYSMAVTTRDKKTGQMWVQILVPEDANQFETGERVAGWYKRYSEKGEKNYEIHAYGDSRFFKYAGTHGIMIVRDGNNVESHFSKAKEIPDELEKEIFLHYNYLIQDLINMGDSVEKSTKDATTLIKNKYGLDDKKLKEILTKVSNYTKIQKWI